jgi:GNAT superfamily N-acetyltransferase
MRVLVAVSEGKVVGTIGCRAHGEEGHSRVMAFLPEWQGTDVALALLETAEASLRKSRCNRVTLDTTEPLKRATRFYEKSGFVPSGRVSLSPSEMPP